jgi:predicted dehydrogenase
MRVGIVGIGFMGWIHYLAYQQCESIRMAAFCSRSADKRRGDWTGIKGNFGPPGGKIDVSSMNVYETFQELLADESIDLIDICLPPDQHVVTIEEALAAGKKVLCEKPLALCAGDAENLLAQAKPGQLFVAHILPFMLEYQLLAQAAGDGRYGQLRSARLKRYISPPTWIPDFYDLDRVGGPLIDLHVHDAHLVRLLFGMPAKTVSGLDRESSGVPQRYETLMTFEDGRYVSSGGGVIDAPGRAFTHGYEVNFEQATLQFEFAAYTDGSTASIPLTILHHDGRIERPDLGDPDPVNAFVRQTAAVAQAIGGGEIHPALDPVVATDALRICEMQMS